MGFSVGDPITTGWSGFNFNIINSGSGTACDIGGQNNGSNCGAWHYDENNENQIWQLKIVNEKANVWTVQNPKSGRYLEVQNGNAAIGTQCTVSNRAGNTDNARHNQEWYIFLVDGMPGQSRICLQNVMSDTFLNLNGCGKQDGCKIQGWNWDASEACVWRLVQQLIA